MARHCESSPEWWMETGRWLDANPRPSQPTWTVSPSVGPHHHRHLLLLISPKADTYVVVLRWMKDWIDKFTWVRGSRLHSLVFKLRLISINQSVSQSINRSIDQLINQSLNQSIDQSIMILPPGKVAEYCDQYTCLFVCLSDSWHISKITVQI